MKIVLQQDGMQQGLQYDLINVHDPDAEIAGLTLTVPSWVSSIERARNNADMNAASTGAKSRLEEALLSLQEKVSEMLSDIREVD